MSWLSNQRRKKLEKLISKYLRDEISYKEFDESLQNMFTPEEYNNYIKKFAKIGRILGFS